ncbi:MAG: Small acid-soluble spore protein family [Epulopiscium sp.]|jgi:H-type small acid-soluble spore protein|uniref:H-type small acid-soluble spore protein n=1 Tax=Defluviitalea raffinosedens TaxID=1450156 RepID=A0A7C8LJV9_9FIRM|nr:H-type small acid-soluble spore protein [Defluviitalea raffinosedens]MBZ4668845.1 Small acid-soluble spore protein family [Defluviitaleaceae bacterium]MDK2787890.1 Small acid-soluble spore protein family [Candidatus Epulonipiscium sp.]KAE9635388.1 H-type small acid-soluble spore protein [Defluviitalea raffinosedens]MBM7684291.1 H-type small acid-soluble spore protein [Defluviitalea raffinosedens]HHW67567.1 H-type small acid-soluble spore protein [Candidatus Epulonipiscium sp.]
MKPERAAQILNSQEQVEVLYQNEPVWIEDINDRNQTAVVRFIGSHHSRTVDLNDLTETGNVVHQH